MSSRNRRRSDGAALDDHEVVGREDRDANRAEQVAGPGEALAVHLHPVAAGRRLSSASISELAAVVVATVARIDRRAGADADHRVGRRTAEARQRRQVGQRLGEVGLALPVVADDTVVPASRSNEAPTVVAEVDQLEPLDDHGRTAGRASRHPDGHQQVQVVVAADAAQTAGFIGSSVDSVTSSPSTASTPAAR